MFIVIFNINFIKKYKHNYNNKKKKLNNKFFFISLKLRFFNRL